MKTAKVRAPPVSYTHLDVYKRQEEGLLELDWRPLMKSLDEDLLKGGSRGCIARKFHESLVNLVCDVAERFCLDRLVLGGGCLQNSFLLEGLAGMAQSRSCLLYTSRCV